ncbi:RNA polymerase ECF-type sigma factor [Plesiocystis pacifica SIR-1]|uniref:RNA polymerase ECF-type sigma factor n=1 Tax=Plesiocystis pacifica SIR-1 TaxID=391625 RepID=A6GFS1_9BACT|nr:sigma-70 family RNA polymerase sigma factor [Plesiocystis pacifica]EDM75268.1 RNA polymerase ECF-type sigma factor [Plesiocystis pacifica SIR-1]
MPDAPPPRPAPTFEALYRQHYDFVWRSARHLGVPEAHLDDVLQETFLVAYRRLDRFERRSKASTWLFAILANVARNHARSRRRVERKLGALSQVREVRPEGGDEFESQRALASRLLAEFLVELDELPRQVFILAELEGASRKEIAAALGVNLGIVQSRLRLARERFTARFEAGSAVPQLRDALRRQPPRADRDERTRHRALIFAAVGIEELPAPSGPQPMPRGSLGKFALGLTGGLAGVAGALALFTAMSQPSAATPRALPDAVEPAPVAVDVQPESEAEITPLALEAETPDAPAPEPKAVAPGRTSAEKTPRAPADPDYARLEQGRSALVAGEAARALELVRTIDAEGPLGWARAVTEVAALCRLHEAESARSVADTWNRRSDPRSIPPRCW